MDVPSSGFIAAHARDRRLTSFMEEEGEEEKGRFLFSFVSV